MRSRVRHRASSSICREATPFQRPWSVTYFASHNDWDSAELKIAQNILVRYLLS